MRLRCLRDYKYGKPTGLSSGGLSPQVLAMLQVMGGGKNAPKPEPAPEHIYEFKAGEIYDLETTLATRLLRDHGQIDYQAWRRMQSRSDLPITSPPRRSDPRFEAVDEEEVARIEAAQRDMHAADRARRETVDVVA